MPRIAVPQQTIVAQPAGNVPQATPDTFGAGVGRAMQGLGNTITQVSTDAIQQAGEYKRKQDLFNVHVQSAQEQADWTQKLDKMKTEAPLGDGKFVDNVLGSFDKETEKNLSSSTMTEEGRKTYTLARQGLRQSLQNSAIGFQHQSMGEKAKVDAQATITNLGQAAAADSNNYGKALDDWNKMVDDMPGIDAVQKAELKKHGQTEIALSAARGQAQRDPQGTKQTLEKSMGIGTGTGRGVGYGKINITYGGSLTNASPGRASPKGAYDYLISQGATPNEALLLTSAAASESGFNQTVSHDGGKGYGLFGHNGTRLASMKRQYGDRPGWQDQFKFALSELRSRPEAAALANAKTPEEITAIQMAFEQPQGYVPGSPESGHNYNGRLGTVRRFYELAGMAAPPPQADTPNDGKTGNPIWDSLTSEQRQQALGLARSTLNQQQAEARTGLEVRVKDANEAYLTTGEYSGAPISRADFARAYDPVDAEQRWNAYEATRQVGTAIAGFKTMSQPEIDAQIAAARPTGSGDGFALEQKKFETLQKAGASIREQRQSDPATYVMNAFPAVRGMWQNAGNDPAKIGAAVTAMDVAYDKMGTPKANRALLPKDTITQARNAYEDETRPLQERVDALKSLVYVGKDPETQHRIFNELVQQDSKLGKLEAAFDADLRGDHGAAERLFRAGMSGGKDGSKLLTLPSGVKEDDIKQKMHDEVLAPGKIGDALYGTTGGIIGNEEKASRDINLMYDAVRWELQRNGGNVTAAIDQVKKDIYGKQQVIGNGWTGAYITAAVPEGTDENAFRKGVEALRPQFRGALLDMMQPADPKLSRDAQAIQKEGRLRAVEDIYHRGVIRNLPGGYGMVNPDTGEAIPGPDGKPLVFKLDQILTAKPGGRPTVSVEGTPAPPVGGD